MLVKVRGAIILRIDDDRKYRRVCGRGAKYGVHDEGSADPPPLAGRRDGKASNEAGRNKRIPGKLLCLLGRQVAKRKTCRGEGVVAGNFAPLPYPDEAIADSPLDVLRRKFAKVPVKRFDAARKRFAVMLRAERFNPDRSRHS